MQKNLVTGKEWKVITTFAIPIFLSNFLQVCYNFTDSVIVANRLGEKALGSIGVTSAFVWLLVAIAGGIGTGISIAVSQYFGAGKLKEIRKTVQMGFLLGVLLGLALTVTCLVIGNPVIKSFLGTPESMVADARTYFFIYSSGILFQIIYNVSYGILRAQGDSRAALFFLLISAVTNVGLDILFIVIWGLGVGGAAAATVIAQGGAALAAFLYLQKYFSETRLSLKDFTLDFSKMKLIFRLSTPVILQTGVSAAGFIILQRLVNSFGEASITGFAAMQKVETFIHIPSNSFNAALTSFAGQNIGAGQLERARKGYRYTITVSVISCLLVVGAVLAISQSIFAIFNLTADSMLRAREHLLVLSIFMPFTTVNNVTAGFLQGAGDVKVPAIGGFINLGIRLICAHIMALTIISFRSIYLSLPFAWVTASLIIICRYRTGKWQNKAII